MPESKMYRVHPKLRARRTGVKVLATFVGVPFRASHKRRDSFAVHLPRILRNLRASWVAQAETICAGRSKWHCSRGELVVDRMQALRHRLATAAGVDANGAALASVGRPPDALLLLSGSHPVRRLLFAKRILPDVYDELRLATSMRDRCVYSNGCWTRAGFDTLRGGAVAHAFSMQ